MSAWVGKSDGFGGRTILLAGAGCTTGASLALGFARAGARVIAVDHEEMPVMIMARQEPSRIDPLRLNLLDSLQRTQFADIWQDEPVHVLVHLQPVRHQDVPSTSIQSVLAMSDLLSPALQRGAGRELIVYRSLSPSAATEALAFQPAVEQLAGLLDRRSAVQGRCVNAMVLPADPRADDRRQITRTALWLTDPKGPPVWGSVICLGA